MFIKNYVLIPENLHFERIEEEFPFHHLPTREKSADYLLLICGTLTALHMKQGGYNENTDGFTSLCAKYLQNFHFDYEKLMDYLVGAGILETNGQFVVGKQCKRYRYAEKYRGQELKEVPISNFKVRKCLKKQIEKSSKYHTLNVKGYMHILKWYLSHKLKIDSSAALKWVNQYHDEEFVKIQSFEDCENQSKILIDKCISMRRFIAKVKDKGYGINEFTVCDAGRRLHGMFTYNKKDLRNFIKYEDQEMISIDIKNSQPFFSSVLLNKEFWMSKKIRSNQIQLYQIAPDIYKEMREDGTLLETITLVESSESLVQHKFSMSRFRNLVVNGEIYEYLLEALPKSLSDEFLIKWNDRVSTRDQIKKEVLRIMYCDPNVTHKLFYEPTRDFNRFFPDVGKLFEVVKKNRYNRLALILQRIESHLVLKVICKNLSRSNPSVPIFTIHDSIVTTAGNEALVETAIKSVLKEQIGFEPKLKLDRWVPPEQELTMSCDLSSNSYRCKILNECTGLLA